MLWLLLTGKVPTEAQTRELSRELAEKGELPAEIAKLVDACVSTIFIFVKKVKLMLCTRILYRFPSTLHPMTQLSMGVAALNSTSQFAAAYEAGMKKSEYWKPALEDSIALIARLPALAARIYRNVYKDRSAVPGINKDLDLVGTCRSFSLR